jgi:hypothetical protein
VHGLQAEGIRREREAVQGREARACAGESSGAKGGSMSETVRRLNNREKVLAALQERGTVKNHELIPIGGMRAMGRVWELSKDYDIRVEHVKGGEYDVTYLGPRRPGQRVLWVEL